MNPERPTLKLFLVALAASLLSSIVLGAGEARACMCEVLSPEEQLRVSDAVFSGEVADIDNSPGDGPSDRPTPLGGITFEVEETWKGDPEEQVVVRGYGPGPSCGIEAREGEQYLVYARYGGEDGDGPLETTKCDGTNRSRPRKTTCVRSSLRRPRYPRAEVRRSPEGASSPRRRRPCSGWWAPWSCSMFYGEEGARSPVWRASSAGCSHGAGSPS